MSSKLEYLLREWGKFIRAHLDYADEYGENILYSYAQYGYTDPEVGGVKIDTDGEPLGRDKVLCPEMPGDVRRLHRAINNLDDLRKNTLTLVYCLPVKEDGTVYTIGEMARMLQINKGKFRAELRKARLDLQGMRGIVKAA